MKYTSLGVELRGLGVGVGCRCRYSSRYVGLVGASSVSVFVL